LHLPTIAGAMRATRRTGAARAALPHLGFPEALLQAELEEREQGLVERCIREARLPRMKL
jgi:hypothetical protein